MKKGARYIIFLFVVLVSCKQSPSDLTPLMYAIIQDDPLKASALITQGVSHGDTDRDGNTALMYLMGTYKESFSDDEDKWQLQLAQKLLERGASTEVENNNGGTPLVIAIYRKRTKFVQLLLQHGADPNYINSKGWTPLMYASIHCQKQTVDELLEFGADPTIRSEFGGKTALDLAGEYECPAVIKLLNLSEKGT